MLYLVCAITVTKKVCAWPRTQSDASRQSRVLQIREGPRLVRKHEGRGRVIEMPRRFDIAG